MYLDAGFIIIIVILYIFHCVFILFYLLTKQLLSVGLRFDSGLELEHPLQGIDKAYTNTVQSCSRIISRQSTYLLYCTENYNSFGLFWTFQIHFKHKCTIKPSETMKGSLLNSIFPFHQPFLLFCIYSHKVAVDLKGRSKGILAST